MRKSKFVQSDVPPLAPLQPLPAPFPRLWQIVTGLLVAAYLGLAIGHLTTTPILREPAQGSFINAPDEAAHFGYIRALADGGRFPVRNDPQFSTYEWHQPPLYYLLCVPFYKISPSAVRVFGLLIGLGGLALIFRAARRLIPNDPAFAALAVGIAALVPMRQATSVAAGNDILIEFFFSLLLVQLLDVFHKGFTPRRAVGIGICLAAALLTKASGLLLLPLVLFAFILLRLQDEPAPTLFASGGILLLIVVLGTGGWYARNWQLYGEFTPAKAFLREFEGTAKAVDLIGQPAQVDFWTGALQPGTSSSAPTLTRADYLGLVANWSFRSFWAAYTKPRAAQGGIPSFLPPNFYLLYAVFVLTALGGMTRLHFVRKTEFTGQQQKVLWLLFATFGLVAASFVGFIWTFFQAQGRYLYPSLLPISLLGAMGFRAAIPERYREGATGFLLLLFGVLAIAFLTSYVQPTYGG